MPTLNLDNAGQNHEVLPGFRFTLMVEGFQEVPLKSVRPFSKENEFEITFAEFKSFSRAGRRANDFIFKGISH